MVSTYCLFYLAARIAASLHKFAISAPENPGVKVASLQTLNDAEYTFWQFPLYFSPGLI